MNDDSVSALLVRAASHCCALNLSYVIEILRPLPLEQLTGAPEIVSGLSIIRGNPVPVLDLAGLFGPSASSPARLVLVRSGTGQIALAVDQVLGISQFSASSLNRLPPLLQNASAGSVEKIGILDSELLFILNTTHLVPEDFLASLERRALG
jgi:purine-binding chemotaxis protein CheW